MKCRRLLGLALLALALPRAQAQEADEAMTLAKKLTEEGAATFDRRQARAMAEFYTADAEVFVVSRNKDTNELKTELKQGRAEIEELYTGVFKNAPEGKARNVVEYARRLGPDLLLIAGVFHPWEDQKVPFVQVRAKQDDRWRIVSLRIFLLPQS